jgi:glycosyltransferase involved in cell wall biosynthesis
MTSGRLVQGLLARGHQVQLVRPLQKQTDKGLTAAAPELVLVAGCSIPCYRDLQIGFPARRILAQHWRHTPPDLVHIVTEGPLGSSTLNLARELRIPVVSGFHTNFHNYSRYYRCGFLSKSISAYLRWFHNRCLVTLAPTAEMAQMLSEMKIDNAQVLARGVDTRLFAPQHRSRPLRRSWGAGERQPVVLYVGRLAAEKNLWLAVRVFLAMRELQPDARFVLVGAGPLGAKLQARYPDFVFCGVRKGADLAAHYASADLFLFPSLTETFGNVTQEAMTSGLAVVAFDYAAAHQYIRHDVDGLLVPVADEAAFITAAGRLVSDFEHTRRLGVSARQAVVAYDWEKIYDRLIDIYQNVLYADYRAGERHGFAG